MSSRQHIHEHCYDSWRTFVPESLLEQSRNPFDSTQIERKSNDKKRNSLEKGKSSGQSSVGAIIV